MLQRSRLAPLANRAAGRRSRCLAAKAAKAYRPDAQSGFGEALLPMRVGAQLLAAVPARKS
jgi:hypothetical protein